MLIATGKFKVNAVLNPNKYSIYVPIDSSVLGSKIVSMIVLK